MEGKVFMDPETGCGLPSTGEKARLLIGPACCFWNSIGWILAASVRALVCLNEARKVSNN